MREPVVALDLWETNASDQAVWHVNKCSDVDVYTLPFNEVLDLITSLLLAVPTNKQCSHVMGHRQLPSTLALHSLDTLLERCQDCRVLTCLLHTSLQEFIKLGFEFRVGLCRHADVCGRLRALLALSLQGRIWSLLRLRGNLNLRAIHNT